MKISQFTILISIITGIVSYIWVSWYWVVLIPVIYSIIVGIILFFKAWKLQKFKKGLNDDDIINNISNTEKTKLRAESFGYGIGVFLTVFFPTLFSTVLFTALSFFITYLINLLFF